MLANARSRFYLRERKDRSPLPTVTLTAYLP